MTDLTANGERYAFEHAADSITARVALWGSDDGWPAEHVALAVHAMNVAGADRPVGVLRAPAAVPGCRATDLAVAGLDTTPWPYITPLGESD